MRLSILAAAASMLLLASPAQAESPRWRPAAGVFEAMAKDKKPAVFWFHGEGLFHNSLSHKFHQKEVVALLRKFHCVQIPGPGGRSRDEDPIAKRFGIGTTIGSIVVCHYDGTEITRYGDIVETRHFVPIVKSWYGAHSKRLKETSKALRALKKGRAVLENGNPATSVLRVTQVLAKANRISEEVRLQAQGFERELLARAERALADARRLIADGRTEAGNAKAEEVKRVYGRLGNFKARAAAALTGNPDTETVKPIRGPYVVRRQDGRLEVSFRYRASPGQRVNLAGSFNGWSASTTPMLDPDGDGTFEVTLTLPSRTLYKFVIDGNRWVQDPENPRGEPDGHGGRNSVIE